MFNKKLLFIGFILLVQNLYLFSIVKKSKFKSVKQEIAACLKEGKSWESDSKHPSGYCAAKTLNPNPLSNINCSSILKAGCSNINLENNTGLCCISAANNSYGVGRLTESSKYSQSEIEKAFPNLVVLPIKTTPYNNTYAYFYNSKKPGTKDIANQLVSSWNSGWDNYNPSDPLGSFNDSNSNLNAYLESKYGIEYTDCSNPPYPQDRVNCLINGSYKTGAVVSHAPINELQAIINSTPVYKNLMLLPGKSGTTVIIYDNSVAGAQALATQMQATN